ncbi:MAG: hypothetical protein ACQGVK_09760 [Myxococcota bacterium]
MTGRRVSITLGLILSLGLCLPLTAQAGCGCDHPPPDWSLVMPPFGSPGRTIAIFADGFEFEPGRSYEVDFGSGSTTATASVSDRIEVVVPDSVSPGPVELKVKDSGHLDVSYSEALFTALPPARKVREVSGIFKMPGYEAAIGADGTFYLALDVSDVLAPMQFSFVLQDLPLDFDHDDVVIYNADGVDLTLFTLEVEDATERQWGSYYGWQVETDSGIEGTYFEHKIRAAGDLSKMSNLFTYWRHEFYTYAAAHAPGGSHEVNENGFHPDGTRHIDHDGLVIAIQGMERDASNPDDPSLAMPLGPGKRTVDVGWVSLHAENPVELGLLEPLLLLSGSSFMDFIHPVDDDDDD